MNVKNIKKSKNKVLNSFEFITLKMLAKGDYADDPLLRRGNLTVECPGVIMEFSDKRGREIVEVGKAIIYKGKKAVGEIDSLDKNEKAAADGFEAERKARMADPIDMVIENGRLKAENDALKKGAA